MYAFIRPVLFLFAPETIHHMVFRSLKLLGKLPGVIRLWQWLFCFKDPALVRTVAGLRFENPVGLAAGFDKDAVLTDELAAFGFGFIEIGTLTPRAQPGNPLPRLFRLPADKALINRMGFNNGGVEAAVSRLRRRNSPVLIGGNIGKNKVTPNEEAYRDYQLCFESLYPVVDYFVVNVSSPNTPGLRALQEKEPLRQLLQELVSLRKSKPVQKPVFLKIAPDLTNEQLDDVVEILQATKSDGVIATNTTISRDGLTTTDSTLAAIGAGGLSGAPLRNRANEVVQYLRQRLPRPFAIIGAGGIMNEQDAVDRLRAGADLVQLYTGFVYEGPGLIKRILRALKRP
ncbi:MAG: quinone-dependent dihydroorotate dehydrogenase [Cyclobacteriaceae bacterium]|nr:quinone-dependent dihydroorotate dehydrogenase [Cyclobacteriaceae bacterium]